MSPAVDRIAVGQQNRRLPLVGLESHPVAGKDVRPVEEIGNPAETLRLALRAIDAVAEIKPAQRAVGLGCAAVGDFEFEGLLRGLMQRQPALCSLRTHRVPPAGR